VTVVATGLNRGVQQGRGRNEGFVSYREPPREQAPAREAANRVPPRRQAAPTLATVPAAADYTGFEKPAVQRFARAVGDGVGGQVNEELLDIPAFLRRQAD
jgi:hypothetical protein